MRGRQSEIRLHRIALYRKAFCHRAFHIDGVHGFEIIGFLCVFRYSQGVAIQRYPFGVAVGFVRIGNAFHRVCCRQRKGHIRRRPAAFVVARIDRHNRRAVDNHGEICRCGQPRVRINDGNLLFNIQQRRVKHIVIDNIIHYAFRLGIAVIRGHFQAL